LSNSVIIFELPVCEAIINGVMPLLSRAFTSGAVLRRERTADTLPLRSAKCSASVDPEVKFM
jgi:hypothetical protein